MNHYKMKMLVSWYLTTACLVPSIAAAPATILRSVGIERRTDVPPQPPCSQNNYAAFNYVGCFVEPDPQTLQYYPNLQFSTMTVETCTATCKSNNFKYAGLIYYGNCQCGSFLPATPVADSECNAPCNGNPNQLCGANQRFSIYQDPTFSAVDLTTIASQYVAKGCYSEGSGYRAVPYRQEQLNFNSLTPEQCLSACGNKYYPLAATEYYGECYCGVNLQGGSTLVDQSNCNTVCSGDSSKTCGGAGFLNLYEAAILESRQPCGTQPPPSPSTCSGTAYGYATSSGDVDKTFVSLGIGKNWGWVIQGSVPVSGNLYLGAGNNDLSKATIVGTFNIDKVGANLVVTYTTSAPWYIGETHLYYSNKNPSKIAPGQFGNKHTLPAGTTKDTYTIPYDASKTTYILHAAIQYQC